MTQQFYQQQVELMLKILPVMAKSTYFALKGGTAINFFYPRYALLISRY